MSRLFDATELEGTAVGDLYSCGFLLNLCQEPILPFHWNVSKSPKGMPGLYTPVILVLRKLGQEICKLEASTGSMMKSCLNKTKQYPHQNETTNQPN